MVTKFVSKTHSGRGRQENIHLYTEHLSQSMDAMALKMRQANNAFLVLTPTDFTQAIIQVYEQHRHPIFASKLS